MKTTWLRWGMSTFLLLVLVVLAGCGGSGGALGGGGGSANGGTANQGHLIYTLSDTSLKAFHSDTGTKAWEVDEKKDFTNSNYQSFLINQGVIYVAGSKLSAIDANTGKIFWQAPIGSNGFSKSSPIVVDNNHVYIVSNDVAYALSTHDGSMQWRQALQSEGGVEGGSSALPLFMQNGILYSVAGGTINALHSSDGSLLWKLQIPDPTDSMNINHLSVDNLAFDSGTLYVQSYKAVVALDAMSGNQRWLKLYGHVYAIKVANNTLYVHSVGEDSLGTIASPAVYSLNLSDGSVKWTSAQPYKINLSGQGGLTQTMSQNGLIYDLGGPTAGDIFALSETNGSVVWNTKSANTFSWLQAGANNLFAVQDDGTISLFDGHNGKTDWQKKIAGSSSVHLITDQNEVYAIEAGGQITAFDPQSGNTLWKANAGSNLIGTIPMLSVANVS